MFVIDNNIKNEVLIKKSKFICYLYKVDNVDDINNKLDILKKEYKDATHICYAYRFSNIEKASDDGEPSGTAGIPILDVLKRNDLINTLVVVIRYFGGIKLGAGGLIRAYRNSVKEALNLVDIIPYVLETKVLIKADFKDEKLLNNLCKSYNVIDKNYENDITYTVLIPNSEYNNFCKKINSTDIKIID